jgi:hypothetical protein
LTRADLKIFEIISTIIVCEPFPSVFSINYKALTTKRNGIGYPDHYGESFTGQKE